MNLTAIAEKHGIQEIELPGWGEDGPFVCRMRRPALLAMLSMGHVPNPLMKPIQALFSGDGKTIGEVPLDEQARAMTQIARHALVEPTYDEITAAGLQLTDNQLMCIYAFAIGGAKSMEPFRNFMRGLAVGDGAAVPGEAEPDSGD